LRKTGRMDIWDRDGVGRIWMTACQMWGRRGNGEQGCGVLGLAMRGNGKGWNILRRFLDSVRRVAGTFSPWRRSFLRKPVVPDWVRVGRQLTRLKVRSR